MAGSRIEKFGTIFTRLNGLLRSGALKDSDKPIWHEIYKAFPPQHIYTYDEVEPCQKVPEIFYPEDIVRCKFYKTFGNPDVVDLTNETVKTTCQTFTEHYVKLIKEGTDAEKAFDQTANFIRQQGIRLRTEIELPKIPAERPAIFEPKHFSAADIFGEETVSVKRREDDMEDAPDDTASPYS